MLKQVQSIAKRHTKPLGPDKKKGQRNSPHAFPVESHNLLKRVRIQVCFAKPTLGTLVFQGQFTSHTLFCNTP